MRTLLLSSSFLVAAFSAPMLAQTGPFGFPCNTTSLIPTLGIDSGSPRVGTRVVLGAASMHGTAPITFLIGVSRTTWLGLALPFALGFLGRPDCTILASGEVMVTVPQTVHAGASLPLDIPNNPALVGRELYTQVLNYDLGPGLAMTNGFTLRFTH